MNKLPESDIVSISDSISSDKSDKTDKTDKTNGSEIHNILDESNYIGPFTDKLIKDFIFEIRKEKNMNKIRINVLDPVLCDINDRYFPHMVTLITLLTVIIILLTAMLVLNIFDAKK
jgi:hypothetical protein